MEAWFADGRIGVVEAVTGAGKTRLGLAAMVDALERGRRVVIMVPTLALVEQWVVRCGRSLREDSRISGGAFTGEWHVLIDTGKARTTRRWASRRPRESRGDEEGGGKSACLRPEFVERLGLTATYERGDDGDDILSTYFREVSFTLGYGRALADGIIAPFRIAPPPPPRRRPPPPPPPAPAGAWRRTRSGCPTGPAEGGRTAPS